MFALIEAAGWPIWPLLLASVISLAIIGERAWSLRSSIVAPKNLLNEVAQEFQQHGVSQQMVARLGGGSPLGQILAAGIKNAKSSPQIMKEALDDAGRGVAHELERFLNTLGTIASISPLLGLLGTVIGMIEIFGSQGPVGPGATLPASRAGRARSGARLLLPARPRRGRANGGRPQAARGDSAVHGAWQRVHGGQPGPRDSGGR